MPDEELAAAAGGEAAGGDGVVVKDSHPIISDPVGLRVESDS